MIDPLAMPIGADTTLVVKTLETIALHPRRARGEHDARGLERLVRDARPRDASGRVFLPMAMQSGLTSAIMDARSPQLVRAVKAADLLLGPRRLGRRRGSPRTAPSKPRPAT